MRRMVALTGAGMSAESGIPTFRGSDGLWENHRIEDVASPDGWNRDPLLVLDFYNIRRKQIREAQPNAGHKTLAVLQNFFDVQIITQNIDDLHERAGSKNVLHLHGEIVKSRSTDYPELIYDIDGWEIKWGDHCEKDSQLRPHIVWFGEEVPMIESAIEIIRKTDILVVVGTSLQVYPAAGLVKYADLAKEKYIIDPNTPELRDLRDFIAVKEGASSGLEKLMQSLVNNR